MGARRTACDAAAKWERPLEAAQTDLAAAFAAVAHERTKWANGLAEITAAFDKAAQAERN